jgi:hypothetical protein
MILECTLDDLMEQVWGDEFMDVCTIKVSCKGLGMNYEREQLGFKSELLTLISATMPYSHNCWIVRRSCKKRLCASLLMSLDSTLSR